MEIKSVTVVLIRARDGSHETPNYVTDDLGNVLFAPGLVLEAGDQVVITTEGVG